MKTAEELVEQVARALYEGEHANDSRWAQRKWEGAERRGYYRCSARNAIRVVIEAAAEVCDRRRLDWLEGFPEDTAKKVVAAEDIAEGIFSLLPQSADSGQAVA